MKDHYTYPRLRFPVDIKVHNIDNQNIILIRCPIGLTDTPLGLVAGVAPILSDFNGKNSITDLANKYAHYGVTIDLVQELVKMLDNALFLDSPYYYSKAEEIKGDFKLNPVRAPALAGLSYPANKKELSSLIADYLDSNAIKNKNLIGLITPHIDYTRGGSCYGKTFSLLKDSDHTLFVLLGTAHQYSPRLFHLTNKDFETPLAKLSTDQKISKLLAERYGITRSFEDEYLHKKEHSLELQTPFLAYLNPKAKILPILVGSYYQMVIDQKSPQDYPEYKEFADILADLLKSELSKDRKICFIVGVDMAHMGQYFGDKEKLSPKLMEQIETRDREYLSFITSQNKEGLFAHIAEDGDARKICGYPSVYLLLDLIEKLKIKATINCIDYQQAVDYENDCAVTFAGVGVQLSSISSSCPT